MSDDDLMPVTRGMLRRWAETLDRGGSIAMSAALKAVAGGGLTPAEAHAEVERHHPSSPSPEGAPEFNATRKVKR